MRYISSTADAERGEDLAEHLGLVLGLAALA